MEPLQRITSALQTVYEHQCEHKQRCGKVLGCPFYSVGTEVSTSEEKLGAKMREIWARKRRYYESAIRDALAEGRIPPCDPSQKALALSSLVDGILGQARMVNDTSLLKNLPQMALELLQAKPAGAVPTAAAALS